MLLALISIALILVIARHSVEILKKRRKVKKPEKEEGKKEIDMPTEDELKALEKEIEKRKREYTIKKWKEKELSDKERELREEWEKNVDIVEEEKRKKR